MKKTNRLFEPLLLLAGIITSYLVFNAYRKLKKSSKKVKVKKWINWELEFNKDAGGEEMTEAVKKIERHVLNYYYSHINNPDVILKDLKFSNVATEFGQSRVAFTGAAKFDLVATVGIRNPPPPPPPPPIRTLSPSVIIDIIDLNENSGGQVFF